MFGGYALKRVNEVEELNERQRVLDAKVRELAGSLPMELRRVAAQAGLFGQERGIARLDFHGRYQALRELAELDRYECSWCGESRFGHAVRERFRWNSVERGPIVIDYCSDPWQESPDRILRYCSEQCLETDDGDFRPEWCETCHQAIAQRCESNGWRGYFVAHDGWLECVACFQERLIRDQESIDEFVAGERGAPCDFFNESDLEDAGYEVNQSLFLRGSSGVETLREIVGNLRVVGLEVVIDQGATAIGGGEGSVTIWTRSPSES